MFLYLYYGAYVVLADENNPERISQSAHSLRDLLDNYKDSYRLDIDVNPKKISSVYGEINKELGLVLKKTLSQAVDFKNKLIESRKNFIKSKIEETEETLIKNSNEIAKLDLERSKIFDV